MSLDKAASQTEYEKQQFGLESKTMIYKIKLELDKSFLYQVQQQHQALRINSLTADVGKCKRLYKPVVAPGRT